jgi:hypothetical protein
VHVIIIQFFCWRVLEATWASLSCEMFGNETVCSSDMLLFTDSNTISLLVKLSSFSCCHNMSPLFVVVSVCWRNVLLIFEDRGPRKTTVLWRAGKICGGISTFMQADRRRIVSLCSVFQSGKKTRKHESQVEEKVVT